MSKEGLDTTTRRGFLGRGLALLAGAGARNPEGSPAGILPENEPTPIEAGDVVVLPNNRAFFVKSEFDEKRKRVLVRYQIPNLPEWKEQVGYSNKEKLLDQGRIEAIPLKEVPKGLFEWHWNGFIKRRNDNGGVKFVPIPGILSSSEDSSFDEILGVTKLLGFGDADVLEPTYKINEKNPLLGESYSKEDSIRDPLKSLDTMDRLLDLWKKQHPLDKLWLLGHSQGGYLAFELARRHSDCVAGVVLLNGAVKGADVTLLPQSVEALGAQLVRGNAGKFFVERGADKNVASAVENQTRELQRKGVVVVSFAATNDDIVKPPFAMIDASDRVFGGEKLDLSFYMEPWREWETAKNIEQETICPDPSLPCLKISDLMEATTKDQSAQLRTSLVEYFGNHGAVLHDSIVKEQIEVILRSLILKRLGNPLDLKQKDESPKTSQTMPPVEWKPNSIWTLIERMKSPNRLSEKDRAIKQRVLSKGIPETGIVYSSPRVLIRYGKTFDRFEGEILIPDIKMAKKETLGWLRSQGFSAEAPFLLPISFYLEYNLSSSLRGTGIVFSPLPEDY